MRILGGQVPTVLETVCGKNQCTLADFDSKSFIIQEEAKFENT